MNSDRQDAKSMSSMSEAVAINGAELFSTPLTRQADSGVWTPKTTENSVTTQTFSHVRNCSAS